ncbi:MAG: protein-disulfide reductase DsbD domain-containing protein [Vicinamibacterales bacterium]
MHMSRALWSACVALALAVVIAPRPAAAQLGLPAGLVDPTAPIETAHLRVKMAGAATPVAAGARVALILEVEPKPSMHVYAPGQQGFIPVSVQLAANPKITVRPAIYPKGEATTVAGETQIVYSRPFRVEVPVTVAAGQAAGPVIVSGTFEYQACDDRVCYAPKKIAVSWPLTVR